MTPRELSRLLFRVCGWTLLVKATASALVAACYPGGDSFTFRGNLCLWAAVLAFAVVVLFAGQELVFRVVRWAGSGPGPVALRVSLLAAVLAVGFSAMPALIATVHGGAFPGLGGPGDSPPWPFSARVNAFLFAMLPCLPFCAILIVGPGTSVLRYIGPLWPNRSATANPSPEPLMPLPDVAASLWRGVAFALILAPIEPLWQDIESGPYNGPRGRSEVLTLALQVLISVAFAPALGVLLIALQRSWSPLVLGTTEQDPSRERKLVASGLGLFLFFFTAPGTARATLLLLQFYIGSWHRPPTAFLPRGRLLLDLCVFFAVDLLQLGCGLFLAFGLPYLGRRKMLGATVMRTPEFSPPASSVNPL